MNLAAKSRTVKYLRTCLVVFSGVFFERAVKHPALLCAARQEPRPPTHATAFACDR